ncbi:MAG: response regulator transcription factor [Calditrichae bacterium]|nr:response regulator transcription factor [Calditrichota bacterium]MCB9058178.1 response regulator transcription factor [Calditrichia bacterium]
MKILIVEDNRHLVQDMQEFLQENGFLIEKAGFLEEARQKINLYKYDLIILDLGLPDGNGLELIPEIKRNDPSAGIIILTAKDTVSEKVKGLEMGADDYITKPFHKAELNARINSTLRRGKFDGNSALEYGHIKINTSARQVLVNNTPLNLTKIEYDLLLYFMYNKNRMLTKESIVEHLWGDRIDESDSFNFIYNHIKNLRKKIQKLAPVNYIHSMYGIGYKFSDKEQD